MSRRARHPGGDSVELLPDLLELLAGHAVTCFDAASSTIRRAWLR
jgi:hypothetical protein